MTYLIAGLDEVGRGALAGPLFAVAALFSVDPECSKQWNRKYSPIPEVNDSKSFSSSSKRRQVYESIIRHESLVDFGIGHVTVDEINTQGIEQANRIAFFRAVRDLETEPTYLLVDGDNWAPDFCRSQQSYKPKADALWWPVGAASILAKVIRDGFMAELATDYQHYRWEQNAGYGTPDHIRALKEYGACDLHRVKFIRKILQGDAHEDMDTMGR